MKQSKREVIKKSILVNINQADFLLRQPVLKQIDREGIREFLEHAIRGLNNYEMRFVANQDDCK
jgi:hypothetical protein